MIKAIKTKWTPMKKKGVTLIEILVSSLLFALIAATAGAALSPMMLAFSRANDIAEYNMILDSIANRITSDIAQTPANGVGIGTNTITLTNRGNTVEYSIRNIDGTPATDGIGILHSSIGASVPTPVFPKDFYGGKTVSFNVDQEDPADPAQGYTVNVTIHPATGMGATSATITRQYAIRQLIIPD